MYESYINELIKDRLFQSSFSKHEKLETLYFIKNFLFKVGHNPLQFNNEVKDIIEEIMIKENICPNCYSDLEIHMWNETRGEHFGYPVCEPMSELRCPSCKWSVDKSIK